MSVNPITRLTDEETKYLLSHPPVLAANGGAYYTDRRAQALAVSSAESQCSWLVSTKEGNAASAGIIGCLALTVAIPLAVVGYNQCMSLVNSSVCGSGDLGTDCSAQQCSQDLVRKLILRSLLFVGCCVCTCLIACQSGKSSKGSNEDEV